MGKKSKKKKTKGPVASSSNNSQLRPQRPAPAGALCWICLEEVEDEHGKPIVRDCSCRGSSGFAHLSCIVKYAESKSEQMGHSFHKDCQELWVTCPGCKQNYGHALAIDMADAFYSFTMKTFPCHPNITSPAFPCAPHRYAEALLLKLVAIFRRHVGSAHHQSYI